MTTKTEESMTLNTLGVEINEVNLDNGWHILAAEDWAQSIYRVPASLALIHSEVSEALEAFRDDDKEHFAEAVADCLIRTLNLAVGLGIDMDAEVAKKLAKNRTRGHKHGGKHGGKRV